MKTTHLLTITHLLITAAIVSPSQADAGTLAYDGFA